MMYRQLHLNSVVPENCLYTPSYGNVNRENYDKPVDGMDTLFSEKLIHVFV